MVAAYWGGLTGVAWSSRNLTRNHRTSANPIHFVAVSLDTSRLRSSFT